MKPEALPNANVRKKYRSRICIESVEQRIESVYEDGDAVCTDKELIL